jgi:hypothetical protein
VRDDIAKGVETNLGEAGNRVAETSKKGTPKVRGLERMDMMEELFTACCGSVGAIEELYF